MAINFTRLSTAWGKLFGALNEWNVARGSTLTTRVGTLRTQFNGIDGDLEDGLSTTQSSAIAAGETWTSYLADRVVAVLASEVKNDRPFADTSTVGLLKELDRQMRVAGESYKTSTCTTATAAIGVPAGNPRIVTSDMDALTGGRSDFLLADVLLLRCQGSGLYALTGNSSVTPATYPTWPGGAGIATFVTEVNPATTSVGLDPGFDQWTSPTAPTYWTVTGAVAQNADTPDGSAYSCQFTGTGALISLRQTLSVVAGQVLNVHFDAKKTASPANTGTLVVRLEDAAGNALSGNVTVNVSAVTGSWVGYTGTLWVPTTVTGTVYVAFRYTGGVGDICRVDRLSLTEATLLYPAGLRLTVFTGPTAAVLNDAWTLTTTVDGGTTLSTQMIRGLDRLIGLASLPVRLPTNSVPTQADALVS